MQELLGLLFTHSHCYGCDDVKQMRKKITRVTNALLNEGGGNKEKTAKLVANLINQPVIRHTHVCVYLHNVHNFVVNQVLKPFVKPAVDESLQQFAANAIATLKKTKEVSNRCGTAKDKLRRAIIVAGSPGPLAKHDVR